jgi:hypothetical protein
MGRLAPFAEHLSGIIKEILIKDLGELATLDLLHKFFFLQSDRLISINYTALAILFASGPYLRLIISFSSILLSGSRGGLMPPNLNNIL